MNEGPQISLGERPPPKQREMPFAVVEGAPVTELPQDLYIPPHALEVFLEAFEGPLDLLLYLIKRQNLDILNIPIAEITRQYMEYVELMKELRLELASEYLVMAAMLAEIKSRILLPRPESVDEDEEDPRAELVRRLKEYERYKAAAEGIDQLPRTGRDVFEVHIEAPDAAPIRILPMVGMDDLLDALRDVMRRAELNQQHMVRMEPLSVRERMSQVIEAVRGKDFVEFKTLFPADEGRLGVVVTFLALLELVRESLVELTQVHAFGPIHVRGKEA